MGPWPLWLIWVLSSLDSSIPVKRILVLVSDKVGDRSCCYLLQALRAAADRKTTLSLSFLICSLGIIILPSSKVIGKSQGSSAYLSIRVCRSQSFKLVLLSVLPIIRVPKVSQWYLLSHLKTCASFTILLCWLPTLEVCHLPSLALSHPACWHQIINHIIKSDHIVQPSWALPGLRSPFTLLRWTHSSEVLWLQQKPEFCFLVAHTTRKGNREEGI